MKEGIINGLFVLFGVAIGAGLDWFRSVRNDRKEREKRAYYLAVRVLCVLDEYVVYCARVTRDINEYRSEASDRPDAFFLMHEYKNKDCFKNLFLPDDVDWKSIEGKLAYRILSLPNRIKRECEACIFFLDYG